MARVLNRPIFSSKWRTRTKDSLNPRPDSLYAAHCARVSALAWLFASIACLLLPAGFAEATEDSAGTSRALTEYQFRLKITEENNVPARIRGELKIRNWSRNDQEYCLFLPYNWSQYGSDRGTIKRFNDITAQKNLPEFSGGGSSLDVAAPVSVEATDIDHIVRLNVPTGWQGDEINMEIESVLPRLPDAPVDEHFFDGFLPVVATDCSASPSSYSLTAPFPVAYSGSVELPPGWDYAGSGRLSSGSTVEVSTVSRSYAFALIQGMKREAFSVGKTPVDILYRTEEFRKAAKTLVEAFPVAEDMLGAFPFPSLTVMETHELQRNHIPELIAINRAGQAFANKIQRDWLNWLHWIATTQLVRQWYGASINASPDDEWLISGLVEFLTTETLEKIHARYDLFRADKNGERALSLDYLQMSEFTAASLRRLSPYTALTNSEKRSLDSADHQHGLSYVRQAFALRQIMSTSGRREFFAFLRALTAQYKEQVLTPAGFFDFTQKLPSPFSPAKRMDIANSLMRWWTDYGWPDFAVDSFNVSENAGRYHATVVVDQIGTIDFPPIVEVTDQNGGSAKIRADRTPEGTWKASFSTQFKPTRAIVDPDHETFDSDRFNNKTGFSGFTFFPGDGSTVYDDKYMIIWVPYGYRLPGEPVTLGAGGALFKYVQSGVIGRFEYAPETKQGAYSLRQMYTVPSWAVKGELSVSYGFDNDRLTELNAIRTPLIPARTAIIGGQVKVRHKDHPGDPDQAHQTFAGNLTFKPKGSDLSYNYNFSAECEVSPEQGRGFAYRRFSGLALTGVDLTERISLGLRYFRGRTIFSGEVPQSALFKPNEIKEANLKVDIKGLDRSADIFSLETGLSLPFYAPLPKDSMVLVRQIQWRLYYDWGKAIDLDKEYHSRGLGIVMPLGGDISGVGSLAVTRFTFLTILNSAAGSEKRTRPGFVFDISGEL
jgi:hypothetical protein